MGRGRSCVPQPHSSTPYTCASTWQPGVQAGRLLWDFCFIFYFILFYFCTSLSSERPRPGVSHPVDKHLFPGPLPRNALGMGALWRLRFPQGGALSLPSPLSHGAIPCGISPPASAVRGFGPPCSSLRWGSGASSGQNVSWGGDVPPSPPAPPPRPQGAQRGLGSRRDPTGRGAGRGLAACTHTRRAIQGLFY